MTRFDVARTQQPKSTAAYGSLRFGPLRYQLKRTIGMLPTPDNSECSRHPVAPELVWRAVSMSLDQPLLVVILFEPLEGGLQLLDGIEGPDPEQVFLQRPYEALGASVAFRGADKGR